MASGRDPGSLIDILPDVPLIGAVRSARMNSHPHLDGAGGKALLHLSSGGERLGGRREGHEERIALRVHLDTAIALECVA